MRDLIFWDVDTQRDFMLSDGKLCVPGAEEIIPHLETLTGLAHARGIRLVASACDHRLEDDEIALKNPDFRTTFPPHCLHGTPGQEKIAQTRLRDPLVIPDRALEEGEVARRIAGHPGDLLILKRMFDVFTNPNTEAVVGAIDPSAVVVYGVALDVCDRFAVEGLLSRGRRVHLVTDAVRAIRPEEGDRLIADWKTRGVGMISTGELAGGGALNRLIS